MKRIVVLSLVLAIPAAHAEAARPHQTKEYVVENGVGTFDVFTSPDFVTVVYLPDPAKRAIASDQKNYSISAIGDTITVRPLSATESTANLEIETQTLKLSIILHVGSADAAMSQVVFRKAEDKAAFEQRVAEEVDKRTADLKAEVTKKEDALATQIAGRADVEIANRILQRFEARALDGLARTADNVVIRIGRAVFVGDPAYVGFEIQNRGAAPYRLKAIAAHQGPTAIDGRASLEAAAAGDEGSTLVGEVAGGSHAEGLIVIDTSKLAPGPLALRFVDAKNGSLDVHGLKVP